MGAARKTSNRMQTSEELDDGWSIQDEQAPLTLQSLAVDAPSTACAPNDDVMAGWALADEAEQCVPAVHTMSALMNPLSDEDREYFSLAEMADGTDVDFHAPDEAWFHEMRCIVPRKRTPASRDAEPTPALKPLAAKVQTSPELDGMAPAVVLAPVAKKMSWWKRLRRSKN